MKGHVRVLWKRFGEHVGERAESMHEESNSCSQQGVVGG